MISHIEACENAYSAADHDQNTEREEQLMSKGNVLLLQIDIEAVTQLIIKKIVPYLNPTKPQALGELNSILQDVNE